MRSTGRRGITLLEVLIVVAILGVLMGLLIPAFQASREAARRSQFMSNLKGLVFGMHVHNETCGALPASRLLGPGRADSSGFLPLMAYMESGSTYAAYNLGLESWDEANATVVSTRLSTYLCPSNTGPDLPASAIQTHRGKPYPGNSTFAAGHYGANWGGVRARSGREAAEAYKTPYSGLMMTVVDPDAPPGTVVRTIGLADITDGTSNTVAMAERRDSFGWAVGGWGGSEFDVNLAPNSPGDGPLARKVFTGSVHPGGINIGLADGSIRFLRGSVSRPIWYGLTTRAGGEKVGKTDF